MEGAGESVGENGQQPPVADDNAERPASISPFRLPEVLASGFLDTADADGALDVAAAAERLIRFAQAAQARALARYAALHPGEAGRVVDEYATDEVAVELTLSLPIAAERVRTAHTLVTRLPQTLTALEDGEIGVLHASSVVAAIEDLTDEQTTAVEARVLVRAHGQTISQFRQCLRRAVHRIDPDGTTRRCTQHRAERHVALIPQAEATAALWAVLPAEDAVAIYRRVDDLAHAAATPEDDRSLDQRRADVFTDLLLGHTETEMGSGSGRGRGGWKSRSPWPPPPCSAWTNYPGSWPATAPSPPTWPALLPTTPAGRGGGCSPTPQPDTSSTTDAPPTGPPPPCGTTSSPATRRVVSPGVDNPPTTPTSTTPCPTPTARPRQPTWGCCAAIITG
jgi:hypothetical protein